MVRKSLRRGESAAIYICLAEISRRTGISYETIKTARDRGELPEPVPIAGRKYYSVPKLLEIFPDMRTDEEVEHRSTTWRVYED